MGRCTVAPAPCKAKRLPTASGIPAACACACASLVRASVPAGTNAQGWCGGAPPRVHPHGQPYACVCDGSCWGSARGWVGRWGGWAECLRRRASGGNVCLPKSCHDWVCRGQVQVGRQSSRGALAPTLGALADLGPTATEGVPRARVSGGMARGWDVSGMGRGSHGSWGPSNHFDAWPRVDGGQATRAPLRPRCHCQLGQRVQWAGAGLRGSRHGQRPGVGPPAQWLLRG